MTGFSAILRRELRAYLISPVAYVLCAVFLLLAGYFYFDIVTYYAAQSLRVSQFPGAVEQFTAHEGIMVPLFSNVAVILLLILPLLTMRLLAEERARGTYELLYTAPVNLTAIVLGKFVAALILYTLILAISLAWPLYTGTLVSQLVKTIITEDFLVYLIGHFCAGDGNLSMHLFCEICLLAALRDKFFQQRIH